MEKTLFLIKPDGVKRKLIGKIIQRIEEKNLTIEELKLMELKKELAEKHYEEHQGKIFYEKLLAFMCNGPLIAMVICGNEAVKVCRKMAGATNFIEAEQGTIRGDFALDIRQNIVHTSDSLKSAKREIKLFFDK